STYRSSYHHHLHSFPTRRSSDLQARRTLTIYSPIAGVVIEKMAVAGQRVEPGMTLYRIADLSTIWVYGDVYEYELPFVKVGQERSEEHTSELQSRVDLVCRLLLE